MKTRPARAWMAARTVRLTLALACLFALMFLLIFLVDYRVDQYSRQYIYTSAMTTPHHDYAIILGAGLEKNGAMTPLLKARVDAALQLYEDRRVERLLISANGQHDGGTFNDDESDAMLRYVLDHNLPQRAVFVDRGAYNTFLSCSRALRNFSVRSAIVVTQEFHTKRAVFLCRHLGMNAVALALPDWRLYGTTRMLRYELRERLAVVKAYIDTLTARSASVQNGPPRRSWFDHVLAH